MNGGSYLSAFCFFFLLFVVVVVVVVVVARPRSFVDMASSAKSIAFRICCIERPQTHPGNVATDKIHSSRLYRSSKFRLLHARVIERECVVGAELLRDLRAAARHHILHF